MPKPDHRSQMARAWLHFHAARKGRGSGSAAPRVGWPAYPRRAEHNTVAEGGNRRWAETARRPVGLVANLPSSRRGLSVAAVGAGIRGNRGHGPGYRRQDTGKGRDLFRRRPERSPRCGCGAERSPSKYPSHRKFNVYTDFVGSEILFIRRRSTLSGLGEGRYSGTIFRPPQSGRPPLMPVRII